MSEDEPKFLFNPDASSVRYGTNAAGKLVRVGFDEERARGGLSPWYEMPLDDPRQPYFEAHDESSDRAEFGKNTLELLKGMGTQAIFSVFSAVRYVGEFAVAVLVVPPYDTVKHFYKKFWEGRP